MVITLVLNSSAACNGDKISDRVSIRTLRDNLHRAYLALFQRRLPKTLLSEMLATVADTVYRDVIDQENAGRGYYYFVEGETSSGRKTAMSDTSEVGAAKVYPVKYHSMVLLSGENKVRISWVIAENTDSVRITFLSPSNQIIDSVLSWRESFWETTLEEGEIGTMEIVSQGSYNMSDPVKDTILSPLQAAELLSISRGKEDTIQLRVSIDREPRVITIYRCDGYEEGLDPKNSSSNVPSISFMDKAVATQIKQWVVDSAGVYVLNDDGIATKGKQHFYRVIYTVDQSSKVWSDYSDYSDQSYGYTAPEVPSLNSVSKDSLGYILVNWEKVAYGDAYRIVRSWRQDTVWTKDTIEAANNINTVTYKDEEIIPGKYYSYAVQTYVLQSDAYSLLSSQDSGYARLVPPEITASKGELKDTVRLSWEVGDEVTDPGLGAEQFVILRKSRPSDDLAPIDTIDYDGNTDVVYDDTIALETENLTFYYYRVYSVSGSLSSSYSNLDSGWVKLPPVTKLTATEAESERYVRLGWEVPVSSKLDEIVYKIYRGGVNQVGEIVGTGKSVTFVDSGFSSTEKGVAHSYKVSYVHPDLGSSQMSDDVIGYTKLETPEPPSASYEDETVEGIEVSAYTVSNADSIFVYRKDNWTTDSFRFSGEINQTFVDDEAVSMQEYDYYCRAWNELTGSSDSSFHTVGKACLFPPKLTVGKNISYDTIKLSWEGYVGKQFKIYRDTVPVMPSDFLYSLSEKGEYLDTEVEMGKIYYYWVSATIGSVTKVSNSEEDYGYLALATPAEFECSKGEFAGAVEIRWLEKDRIENYVFRRYPGEAENNLFVDFQVNKSDCDKSGDTLIYYDTKIASDDAFYFYKMRAHLVEDDLDLEVFSDYTDVDSGWKKPEAPRDFTVSKGLNTDTIRLQWSTTKMDAGDSIFVFRAKSAAGFGQSPVQVVAGDQGEFLDTAVDLNKGAYYYYKIQKKLAGFGLSFFSEVDSGYLLLPAPTSLQASDGFYLDTIKLKWDTVPLATGYKVYRKFDEGVQANTIEIEVERVHR